MTTKVKVVHNIKKCLSVQREKLILKINGLEGRKGIVGCNSLSDSIS